MFGHGTWEILLILIAALVFIGPSKLPSLARTMGKGMRDVRRAMAGFEDEVRQASTITDLPDEEPPAEREPEQDDDTVPQSDEITANADPETDGPPTAEESPTSSTQSDDEVASKHDV